MSQPDLFDMYFKYRSNTEVPAIFHRWAITACLGAWMGRQVWFPFGSTRIFPTQYIMFVGDPGSRKTTAINMAVQLLRSAGYANFGAQRTSKEKFLLDLAGEPDELPKGKFGADMLQEINVFGDDNKDIKEILINADEFNNFMGPGNLEFQGILGELWDWDNTDVGYIYRLKNSRSLNIFQPTISILAGNTPSNFALCFPPTSIGQGFMSRLLLIHGESTGRKITFPETPNEQMKNDILRHLMWAKQNLHGEMKMHDEARGMVDMIYKTWPELEDTRFKHYSTRRLTHLLRLCIVYACARISQVIEPVDVIRANTVLAYAETLMPKALGELGKSRHSEAANKIMQALFASKRPMNSMELWKIVRSDVDKPQDLTQILANLQYADQIFSTVSESTGHQGFLPKTKIIDRKVIYIDYNYLKGKELPA